ncbi:uncharacterized protein DUF3298 [Mucilaginibacter yixingensis]|uniref:Uncharacterized protein DUF3298 n=1 Tax=Mucilaginibacter yixingensis TaxID=1295612 RepID=A0A2T5J6C7_9SPHI|nr:RsiV family protein [Mucilaginibacter yixingensis]PTQ94090.1 uncharacterized protein DUF3298 [Mucilaginibacter yixingensis]
MKKSIATIKASLVTGTLALLMLSACKWRHPNLTHAAITRDTLKYKYQEYTQKAGDCGKRADSSCSNVRFSYPEFDQPELNGEVQARMVSLFQFHGFGKARSMEQLADDFLAIYKADSSQNKLSYLLHINARVITQDSSLTTLQVSGEQFSGKGHGGSMITFVNWNNKTKQPLALEDILKDNSADRLNAVAEKLFRARENLADTASLKDYFFDHDKFQLNENFLITPIGLRFLYNQQEIKPAAAGQTDLLIPYPFIRELLKPNTVIAQYHP